MTNSKSKTLENYRVMVQNASTDSVIKNRLLGFGYNEELLQKGPTLYEAVNELFLKQKTEYMEQYEAQADFIESREKAESEFMRLYKIANIIFRKNDISKILPENGLLTPYSAWKQKAAIFYTNIKSNLKALEMFSRFKINTATLQVLIEDLKVLDDKKNKYEIEKGEAQVATRERNEKFEELKEYCYELKELSRIAFEDNPQILEKMGVLVRS